MQKIDDLLNEDHQRYSTLSKLLRSAATQQHLTAGVRALLPTAIGRGISAVTMEGPKLRIHCDDGAIATRLRFQLPMLKERLLQLGDFAHLEQITVKVVPPA
ncbi:MAG: DciA family protein [Pseudomonadota bacterium]